MTDSLRLASKTATLHGRKNIEGASSTGLTEGLGDLGAIAQTREVVGHDLAVDDNVSVTYETFFI